MKTFSRPKQQMSLSACCTIVSSPAVDVKMIEALFGATDHRTSSLLKITKKPVAEIFQRMKLSILTLNFDKNMSIYADMGGVLPPPTLWMLLASFAASSD
jgi:hypothetical protein